jgi:hypothetical protein
LAFASDLLSVSHLDELAAHLDGLVNMLALVVELPGEVPELHSHRGSLHFEQSRILVDPRRSLLSLVLGQQSSPESDVRRIELWLYRRDINRRGLLRCGRLLYGGRLLSGGLLFHDFYFWEKTIVKDQ